ncbi:MAG: thermonuclease family protein [Eubacteriaceae bacterium]|nr:thermonuclease family protein [Eubacteriaceae bacterium]
MQNIQKPLKAIQTVVAILSVLIGIFTQNVFSCLQDQSGKAGQDFLLEREDIKNGAEEKLALYRVVRVVDGDTIIIDINGKNERLRFIGLDAPESVHPNEEKNTPIGFEASDFTKSWLEGKDVGLEMDVGERDKYRRLLAYVWLDGVMFNELLVESGYAYARVYPPNVKYTERLAAAQERAKKAKVGIWAQQFGE